MWYHFESFELAAFVSRLVVTSYLRIYWRPLLRSDSLERVELESIIGPRLALFPSPEGIRIGGFVKYWIVHFFQNAGVKMTRSV
jgi:hypothetical protein